MAFAIASDYEMQIPHFDRSKVRIIHRMWARVVLVVIGAGQMALARSLVQVSVSVAGVAQAVAAVSAVRAVVGGGGVQSRSGMDQGSGMDQRGGMHNRDGLGGHLVGVGVRGGHGVGHGNGGSVALDDRGVRDHGGSGVGRSQGGAVTQSVAMAVGGDHSGIGHGAQGKDEGNLGVKMYFNPIQGVSFNPFRLTSLNILVVFGMLRLLD